MKEARKTIPLRAETTQSHNNRENIAHEPSLTHLI